MFKVVFFLITRDHKAQNTLEGIQCGGRCYRKRGLHVHVRHMIVVSIAPKLSLDMIYIFCQFSGYKDHMQV